MEIGDRIRIARNSKGWTQKELAAKAGIATTSLQQYEYFKRQPTIEQLQKIADALDVPFITLLANQSDIYKMSRFVIRDWLYALDYRVEGANGDMGLWLIDVSSDTAHEITDEQLTALENSIRDYTKFQVHDLLKKSEGITMREYGKLMGQDNGDNED